MSEELNAADSCSDGPVVSETNKPHPKGEAAEDRLPRTSGNFVQVAAVCGSLLLAVGLVFGRTTCFDFIALDDPADVKLNPHVNAGLRAEAVWWLLTHRSGAGWMPMTSLSHMLDCELFGLNAGGHHLTNVILHAAVAVLLFLVLRQWTGRLWPSALVAAVFAIHPLRVESVAWVTERKDVLSGLFFMLTLWAYGNYARRRFSIFRYSAVLVFFALGLMSKPMLATTPFLLLLLDYWPLGRWTIPAAAPQTAGAEDRATPLPPHGRWRMAVRLLLEKVPLLAMAAGSCIMTISAHNAEILSTLRERYDLTWRLGTALLSYVYYLGMFFYPVGLATPYPRPDLDLPYGRIAGAAVVLVVLSVVAVAARRKYPYLFVGWFWYLGMLVPVIGIFQFGIQTVADRFTYLPQIGLTVALTWTLADAFKSWRLRRQVYAVAAGSILVVLMGCAFRQTAHWRNDRAFWSRSLACDLKDWWAYYGLGTLAQGSGEVDEAVVYYQKAIAIKSDEPLVHYNLAVALAGMNRLDEAVTEYKKTLELQPNNAVAKNNLGNALLLLGDLERAMSYCREAVQLDPDFAEAHFNIGSILVLRGRADEAIEEYERAVDAKPDYQEAHYALGTVLAQRGRLDEAIDAYRKALEPQPVFAAEIHYALGLALAARDRPEEAATHFQEVLALRPNFLQAKHQLEQVSQGKKGVE